MSIETRNKGRFSLVSCRPILLFHQPYHHAIYLDLRFVVIVGTLD